jgi:aminoglycoside 3-N-acetyltransferase I
MEIRRLRGADRDAARSLFTTMAGVFGELSHPLADGYLDGLLARDDFWAISAQVDGEVVGGLTAHTLPMTRAERSEVLVYDIAVSPEHQRRGVGRGLVDELRQLVAAEGIDEVFVPVHNDDAHALDFYRALRGEPAPVTIFTFSGGQP